jgi:hypothetical protein
MFGFYGGRKMFGKYIGGKMFGFYSADLGEGITIFPDFQSGVCPPRFYHL